MPSNHPSDDAAQRLKSIEKWFREHEIHIKTLQELCEKNGVKLVKKARRGKNGTVKPAGQLKADLLAKLSQARGPEASEIIAATQTFLTLLEVSTSSVGKECSEVSTTPETNPIAGENVAGPSRNPADAHDPLTEPSENLPFRASSTPPNIVATVGDPVSSQVSRDGEQDACITPADTEPATPSQSLPSEQGSASGASLTSPSSTKTSDDPKFTDEEYAVFGKRLEGRVRRREFYTFVRREDEARTGGGGGWDEGRRWVSWKSVPSIMEGGSTVLTKKGVLLGSNQLDITYVEGLCDPRYVHEQDMMHEWMRWLPPTPRSSVEPVDSKQDATEQGQPIVDGILGVFVDHLTTYQVELLDKEQQTLRKWLQGVLDRQQREAKAAAVTDTAKAAAVTDTTKAAASDSGSTCSTGSQKRGRESDGTDNRSAGDLPAAEGDEERTTKRPRRSPRKIAKAGVARR
ncbi:hypothetical protein PsYK624_075550 [Phanerochaete sordida]|uniref:Uncharacterized protein n=1 Tax=Phanerochaete sordida TaxID=48140 RepID=A0A9P3LDM3_9APHY|nr:hypothetical protein PsYK624_075550 [Phanerochaete sordida]